MLNGVSRKLLIVLLIAFLVRVSLLFVTPNITLFADAREYDLPGQNLAKGYGFSLIPEQPTSWRPPLFPAFLGAVYKIFGYHLGLARFIQISLSVGIVFVTYLLGKLIFNINVGLIASLIVGLYPGLVLFSNMLYSETLFIFLFTLTFYLILYSMRRDSVLLFSGVGVLIGLSALIRPIGLSILPLFIVLIVLKYKKDLKKSLGRSCLVFLVTFLVILPWSLRNYLVFGQFIFIDTNQGSNLYIGNSKDTPYIWCWKKMEHLRDDTTYLNLVKRSPEDFSIAGTKDEAEKSRLLASYAISYIKRRPLVFIQRFFGKIIDFWSPERFTAAVIKHSAFDSVSKPLMGLAILIPNIFYLPILFLFGKLIIADKWDRNKLILVLLTVTYIIPYAIFFAHPRYHLTLIPLIVVYVTPGIINIGENLYNKFYGPFHHHSELQS